jgi:hypothetical protein
MNNKQKTIITIYVIVAFLGVIALAWIGFVGPNQNYCVGGYCSYPKDISNQVLKYFEGAIIVYVISLIILGIPAYILYRVWGDKK